MCWRRPKCSTRSRVRSGWRFVAARWPCRKFRELPLTPRGLAGRARLARGTFGGALAAEGRRDDGGAGAGGGDRSPRCGILHGERTARRGSG